MPGTLHKRMEIYTRVNSCKCSPIPEDNSLLFNEMQASLGLLFSLPYLEHA